MQSIYLPVQLIDLRLVQIVALKVFLRLLCVLLRAVDEHFYQHASRIAVDAFRTLVEAAVKVLKRGPSRFVLRLQAFGLAEVGAFGLQCPLVSTEFGCQFVHLLLQLFQLQARFFKLAP